MQGIFKKAMTVALIKYTYEKISAIIQLKTVLITLAQYFLTEDWNIKMSLIAWHEHHAYPIV